MYTFQTEAFNEKKIDRALKDIVLKRFSDEEQDKLVTKLKLKSEKEYRTVFVFDIRTKKIKEVKILKNIESFDFEGFGRHGERINTTRTETLWDETVSQKEYYSFSIYFGNSNNSTTQEMFTETKLRAIPLAITGEFLVIMGE